METGEPGPPARATPAPPPEATLAAARWPKLAYELALGVDDAPTIAARHGITHDEFRVLLGHPTFRQMLEQAVADVRSSGAGYKEKAKVIAEDLLPDLYGIAKNPAIHPSIRVDAAKFLTGVAGLGPQKEGAGAAGGGSRFVLKVVLGARTEQLVAQGAVIENEAVEKNLELQPLPPL